MAREYEYRARDIKGQLFTGLVLADDQQREVTVPMPEDQLYVSFAPYVSQTHDCWFHSLTTCTGELRSADVKVTVTDATGATILDETSTTYDNGFLGVWLPRDIDGTLTVEHDGKVATSPISTKGDEAATCVTTSACTAGTRSGASVTSTDAATTSCSAWLMRSAATKAGSAEEPATIMISVGPASLSMPITPRSSRLAAVT